MKKHAMVLTFVVIYCSAINALANPLSIYEIQYTTDPNGTSPLHGNIIDCIGGIVTHIPPTGRPRLVIQDPNYFDGWGAIQVKDLDSTGVFADVNVGDCVSLTNVEVEDNKGTTFLQYIEDNNAGFTIVSKNNPIPRPLTVTVEEITAPLEGFDSWIVPDHNAEKYESMLIKILNISVKDTGYGKAYDNYILQSSIDPNLTCWASDYMNSDKDKGQIYHPYTEIGQDFCSVTGVLEQYTTEKDGIYYDYHQLLTTYTADLKRYTPADLNGDCMVDFSDFAVFSQYWLWGVEQR